MWVQPGTHKGTMWANLRDPHGNHMGNLSQRDPAGSPLSKTGGIPLGIPYGPHMSSQMGPVRVPNGVSRWDITFSTVSSLNFNRI